VKNAFNKNKENDKTLKRQVEEDIEDWENPVDHGLAELIL
jgi:hypothetical protein